MAIAVATTPMIITAICYTSWNLLPSCLMRGAALFGFHNPFGIGFDN
jgi:hypothetical protein